MNNVKLREIRRICDGPLPSKFGLQLLRLKEQGRCLFANLFGFGGLVRVGSGL